MREDTETGAGRLSDGFARRRLLGVLSGGVVAQCCYAVAKLGIPDLLAAGPLPATELAARTGANAAALRRMLRALSSMGVFRRTEPETYALTSTSELLRSGIAGSLRQTAILHGEEVCRSFTEIMHTVHTGQPAFAAVHGMPFYDYLGGHPEVADSFAEAMGSERVPAALFGSDLRGTLVDVGGGNGGLLAEILTTNHDLRGVLFELPDAVRAARVRLHEAGVVDRVTFVQGSFFDRVPDGGDVYVLARVLHNWTDEHAELILHQVGSAMPAGARLIVLERLVPEETAAGGLVDLLMLGMLEGHDRTELEYLTLLEKAGFEVTSVRPGPAECAIEAVRR